MAYQDDYDFFRPSPIAVAVYGNNIYLFISSDNLTGLGIFYTVMSCYVSWVF
jgi:hypothetical protein